MKEWQIPAGGVIHSVRLEEGPGGKMFVRSNGRMIAQPLTPADHERLLSIGGDTYRIVRTADGFDLEPVPVVEQPAQIEPEVPREPAVMPLGLRSRVYFTVAFLMFLGSSCGSITVASFRDRATRAFEAMPGASEAEDRSLERANRVQTLISSGLAWQAVLAFVGFVGAAYLARGARWAPRVLEIVTWAMLAVAFFALARIDRTLHIQMHAAFGPAQAGELISKSHRAGLLLFGATALLIGWMLQLIRSDITGEQVEKVY